MSASIQLFKINDKVEHLPGGTVFLEVSLQRLIENNMEIFFNISFLASEYYTGRVHGGRIDSLGIDDTNCPVILEYKRHTNENVINQGLYYLDWLMDHKAEFELLVLKMYGKERSEQIDWNGARLVCIAGDFTKYDEHAVKQINRNIELVRYIKYTDELLLFELINKNTQIEGVVNDAIEKSTTAKGIYKTAQEYLDSAPQALKDLFNELLDYCYSLGDDVTEKVGKNQFIFKRFANFLCAEVHTRDHELVTYLKVDPDTVTIEPKFIRDMRDINHWGTGDLEVRISDADTMERAKELIQRSYEGS
jgi:predicted transport protein